MGVPMRRDQPIADKIRRIFESRGRVMSANNLRQADIPEGASPIAQMPGTAPGLVCPVGDKVIYAMPGVPSEMREMFNGTILPDLRRRMGQTAVIRSRVLRTWGASESGIAEMVADRMVELDKLGNPTIAFQASGIDGIKVRIVAKCDDEATAKRVLDSEETLMRSLLGDLIFGIDEQSMEAVVLARAAQAGADGRRCRDADRRHPLGAHERARPRDGDLPRRQHSSRGNRCRTGAAVARSSAPQRRRPTRASGFAPTSGSLPSFRKPPKANRRARCFLASPSVRRTTARR